MKEGALRVWWIPQIPMKPFEYPVNSPEEGAILCDVLAQYDLFQLTHDIKPDYCNAGGLQIWDKDADGEGNPGWVDWCSDDGTEFDEMMHEFIERRKKGVRQCQRNVSSSRSGRDEQGGEAEAWYYPCAISRGIRHKINIKTT